MSDYFANRRVHDLALSVIKQERLVLQSLKILPFALLIRVQYWSAELIMLSINGTAGIAV